MQDKAWKVLIVDDEFRIGMLINKLIKWDELKLECVKIVDNGETAFQTILSEKPDIVITDIRMPKISGLDLIRMTKEKNQEIKFIVISGYKEFDYAHQALQYGVTDYLLKPVNEEELNDVLKKKVEELNNESKKLSEENQLKKIVTTSEQIIKSNLLSKIIEQNENPTFDEMKEEYNLDLNATAYRGIVIKFDYMDYEKRSKKQDRMTIDKSIDIVEKNLSDIIKEHLFCEKDNLNIYCLINYDCSDSAKIKNAINNILTEIQGYLLGFEQYKVTIGIGLEKYEFGDIRFSIQESLTAVQNRIKLGTGRLIYADLIRLDQTIDVHHLLDAYKDKLLMSIESFSIELFEETLNKVFGELQFKVDIDFSCCYELANEIIELYFDHISVENQEVIQMKQLLKNASSHCNSVMSLKNLLKNKLKENLAFCLNILETESIKPIRKAKQYIEEHLKEKIVLEDIAEIVELNPVYFSVLFKKETGTNFSSYLVDVRMEKAKDLIRSSNKTIAAIADEVGYKDARYFSQLFTKTVGIKPALYRKIYS